MKNLRVLQKNPLQLQEQTLGFCIDADNGVLYVVKHRLQVLKISTHQSEPQKPETIQHDLSFTPELDNICLGDIRLIEFIVESGSILIVLKSGQVLTIGVSSFSPPSSQIYKHDAEISSIRLSPDQDLIALADDRNDIHIIGIDGEIMHKDNSLSQNVSLHKPVGVGWGSKETQFFGLDGRPSKEKQLKEQVTLSEEETRGINMIESSKEYKEFRSRLERNTIIDWRGDGQYLATLTFINDLEKHYLKVWNRNLELQYMSEQLVNIERGILTWIPNGHFICCAQRRDNIINEVAMFEKNGLVHQRISLPQNLKYLYVKEMIWSPNSRVLAIIANQFNQYKDGRIHFSPLLLLYTMQNFHYYLKFTTKLSQDLYYTARWNPINHNKLQVMSENGSYHEYICNHDVCYSEQYSTVAVIDSNKVMVTPIQISAIPPPMAAITLEVTSPILGVALNPYKPTDMFIFELDNRLICINSYNKFISKDCDGFLKVNQMSQAPDAKLKSLIDCYKSSRIYNIDNVQAFQNFTFVNCSQLIATQALNNSCAIVKISLSEELVVDTIAKLDNQVVAVARTAKMNYGSVVLVDSAGSALILDVASGKLRPLFRFGQNQKLDFMKLHHLTHDNGDSLISLFQDMNLLLNSETFLSTSCTSFSVTENYLIYTTTENHMHFLLLDRLLAGEVSDTCSQPIEFGATLIVTSEADAKVVLQMPRGNLEVLHPRILIFSALTRLLDSWEFLGAMQVARRHRVNMNFICDYLMRMTDDSSTIIMDFACMIASHNPQLLLLFLTELDDDDTIDGRYQDIMKQLPKRAVLVGQKRLSLETSKVQRVCTSIELPNDHKFLQPKLLSFLKQTPKKTGEALCLVHALDKQFQRELLEFMLYFIDVEQLFLDALRTYNTDIALMVAGVSHKDPKEYLALLDRFNAEKNELLRAFNIDMHTKYYGDAFAKLLQYHDTDEQASHATDTHSQLREIATSKRIFKQALSCFKSTTRDIKLFEQLWSDYGSYLLEKRCYLEAGIAFSKALELRSNEIDYFNKALNCFSLAGNSENAFALISKLSDSDSKMEPLVLRLLEEGKSPEAIALFITNRQKSLDGSEDCAGDYTRKHVKRILDKNHWYLVDLVYSKFANLSIRQIIADVVRDNVESQLSTSTEELNTIRQQFDRLKELLKTYKSRAASEQTNKNFNYISDSLSTVDGSEISSTVSGSEGQSPAKSGASSIKTRNSSKSKKSQTQRKKRINLKPGSRYEDLALALELRRYVQRQKIDEEEAMRLSAGLFEYCYSTKFPENNYARRETKRLNDLIAEQFDLRQTILSLLWPDSPMNEQMFSLYRRFNNIFSDEGRNFENEEFEVLMRPNLPKEPTRFEL